MSLDRGTLAKIDRRLFSELDHRSGVQLVKVPVSDATWSTWRRYCDAVGVTMGRGLAVLHEHELAKAVDVDLDEVRSLLEKREAELAAGEVAVAESEKELAVREGRVAHRERMAAADEARQTGPQQHESPGPPVRKMGRNQPCWCGSGKKFKYCHDRPASSV